MGEADDFGEGEADGDGEESDEGGVEDFRLGGAVATGVAGGVGDAFCKGFTGPVGLRGAAGGDLATVGEGDGAAVALESGR
jgi:hypothetical protein